jgi:hypothetical protein
MKICIWCKVEKEESEFNKDKRNKDGLVGNCRVCGSAASKRWSDANKKAIKERGARYYQENKEYIRKRGAKYYRENKERFSGRSARYYHKVLKHSPDYKAACAHRKVLTRFLTRYNGRKEGRTHEVLGYSVAELKKHLELQFSKGMTWENYGEWHIDHIVSVAQHVRNGETDPSVVNALSNLRPLWAQENRIKRDKADFLI